MLESQLGTFLEACFEALFCDVYVGIRLGTSIPEARRVCDASSRFVRDRSRNRGNSLLRSCKQRVKIFTLDT